MRVNTDPKKIDEILERGPVDVIVKEEIRKDLLSGRKLNIYYGIDPTGKDMHLGHASTQMKIRDFQELGHNIFLLVGDYTVRVGDHSDQEKQREEMTDAQIEENMRTFKEQYGKTVDLSNVKIVYNSEWLSKLSFLDVINLARIFTVQQMIERDAFAKRLKENNPIGFDELLYPIMQGYDALALKTDIQIEGTDQLFNMVAGRKIMEHFGMKPQGIITMPMLIGPDGREMHKSFGNYIGVMEDAKSMYGKIMSMKDDVMIEYFILLTRIPMEEIRVMESELKSGKADPLKMKKKLALEITKFFNGMKDAIKAQGNFEKTVQKGETPDEMEELAFSGQHSALELAKELVEKGIIASNADAKRLIQQGGIQVDDQKVTKFEQELELESGTVIKVGKRKFVRIE
ncbi:MAG: tyrosine--tRNA ligase [Candidatus Dojkabacteria bacterium]|nr:tyrosine--tRNA ligase [Candidatus Dojkabacteria bacterium]